ncbi:MAG: hypothetical protein IH874_00025 [Candidatus Dadabacteria bacterium]|nr:hypothetical protein [Candidatus Dadabacteria bacterium]
MCALLFIGTPAHDLYVYQAASGGVYLDAEEDRQRRYQGDVERDGD